MFDFMKNSDKITIKCRWGSEGAVSSGFSLWQSPVVVSRGKGTEKFWSFYIWRANR